MSDKILQPISAISKIYEIEMSQEANQDFSTFIDGANWDFSIQTFADGKTAISINKDGVCVCAFAPITILGVNLLYYSSHTSGAFFLYSKDATLKNPTYKNLGKEVKLYYGYF